MKRYLFILIFTFLLVRIGAAQSLYYPPLIGNSWDTLSAQQLAWCTSQIPPLYQFLDSSGTKAFIVLKDGKIVLEKYFGTFTADSSWYWASAGKSLTSLLIGLAQQDAFLSIHDSTTTYLGSGWTSCPPPKEGLIQIKDQLQMTTGLDDNVPDPYCTTDTCLLYLADAGTRWAYHNAPYTLLDQVIQNATGQNLNTYFLQKLVLTTGMSGLFIPVGYNNVFFSTARSAARFALLMLGQGYWNGNQILTDTAYYQQMISPSQSLNQAYGYLWWLNGTSSFMLPGTQIVFNGSIAPDAPPDMYSAIGKNAQIISVIPSSNLIVIRLGDNPDLSLVPLTYTNMLWKELNKVLCTSSHINETTQTNIQLYPNPVKDLMQIIFPKPTNIISVEIIDLSGKLITTTPYETTPQSITLHTKHLSSGLYSIRMIENKQIYHQLFIKQ